MSTSQMMALAVGLVMVVYAAVALRTLVRMRRARALVLEADMPEHGDTAHGAMTFAQAREWFAGKDCAACGRPIEPLHHVGPQPGLKRRAPGSHPILTWKELRAGASPVILETYMPLCANCQIAESLKQEFPGVVTSGRRTEAPH